MRIVLCGLPCAGKDYLIERMLFLTHIKGSEWLNQHSDGKFRELPEGEKERLRKEFIRHVGESEGDVIVDGHYSFPDGDGFRIAFTEDDFDCYDVFAYLDTPEEIVRDRISRSEKNEIYGRLTADDLTRWREFEIGGLREECMKRGKEFLILDNDVDRVTEFMKGLTTGDILTAPQAAMEFAEMIAHESDNRTILLSDGDKTLTYIDLTKSVDVPEELKIKGVFDGDKYTTYQFWVARQTHSRLQDIDARMKAAAEKADFVPEVLDDVRRIDAFRVVVSAGLMDLWTYAIRRDGVFDMAIGADPQAHRNLSQTGKMLVARYLRQKGFRVIAMGDNMVDYYMLREADKAFILGHRTKNATLQKTVLEGSTFLQPEYNQTPFEGVRKVANIHDNID